MAEGSPRAIAGSVRVRTTVAALAVVSIALIVVATGLLAFLERGLERDVARAARLRAQTIAATLDSGTDPSELALRDEDDAFVQVISDGEVVAASPRLAGQPIVVDENIEGEAIVEDIPIEDDDAFLVVEERNRADGGIRRVLVGRNLDAVDEAISLTRSLLLIAIPLLLLLMALVTWKIVGRALRPVDDIRKEVTEISGSQLHRRVMEPDSSDEIADLARTMNLMLDRIESSDSKRKQLVADASHELRNPIAAIRSQAEIALAHPGSVEQGGLAEEILKESRRLESLAEDLLLLARADERTLMPSDAVVDLDDILLAETARLRPMTSIEIDTSGIGAARVTGDGSLLARAVANLLDNAVRYASSRIWVGSQEDKNGVRLVVDDDGSGVPADDRDRIFERFARLDEARDRARGGAGLGLAITREIVEAHGGRVVVLDAPGGGARFEVVLPADGRSGTVQGTSLG